jgi:hypothetical protein
VAAKAARSQFISLRDRIIIIRPNSIGCMVMPRRVCFKATPLPDGTACDEGVVMSVTKIIFFAGREHDTARVNR